MLLLISEEETVPVWLGDIIQYGSRRKSRDTEKELSPGTRGWPEEECSAEEQGKEQALKLEGWWVGGSAAEGKAVPLKE